MAPPDRLRAEIVSALRAAEDHSAIESVTTVGGGDINEACRISTGCGDYFVKWHQHPPSEFFACEARGLKLLAEASEAAGAGIAIPEVVGTGTDYLILRWIERGGKSEAVAELLGRGLALIHRIDGSHYGLDHDNYIGRLPQPNGTRARWVDFYRDQRIGEQLRQAVTNGLMPPRRREGLRRLMARLDDFIDEEACQPSLLHGDLWGGNWLGDENGRPVLIDPAVYLGDREADLAMTALFGGFPRTFYDAYEEVFPLAPGWRERRPLYQLYYLLCHLNLFGESYGAGVDRMVRKYVG